MSKKKKKSHQSDRNTTSLSGHKRVGKALVPPLMQIPGVSFASWSNDRLPEMLWACLIITVVPREAALELFRKIASIGVRYRKPPEEKGSGWTLRHSDLQNQPREIVEEIVSVVRQSHTGIQALRPLLLLEGLPAHQWWKAAIAAEPNEDDWQTLRKAVQNTFEHQSQEATDVRWVSILFKMAVGEIHMPEEEWYELTDYPYRGDMRSVRPSIRAVEMTFADATLHPWPDLFWDYVLQQTSCVAAPLNSREGEPHPEDIQKRLVEVREALLQHWYDSLSTTGLNPKHDGVFGFGFYALACLAEMSMGPLSAAITGRLLLRSLTECRISLAFLVRNGTDEMWKKFRSYGAGQAKLALLKHEAMSGQKPRFVTQATLEALANEDYFQEYVEIDLGHWCGKDLRRLAEESGTKDDYDRYYGWASGFVHGQWGAMRDTNFTHCLNPLHRFHRIPLPFHRMLEPTTGDALHLVNCILNDVNTIYPGFDARFVLEDVLGDE